MGAAKSKAAMAADVPQACTSHTTSVDATQDAVDGHAKATAMMQMVLNALRPAYSNSCGVEQKLHIFVHEWADHAGMRPTPLSSGQQAVREQFRRNDTTRDAMRLYQDATLG